MRQFGLVNLGLGWGWAPAATTGSNKLSQRCKAALIFIGTICKTQPTMPLCVPGQNWGGNLSGGTTAETAVYSRLGDTQGQDSTFNCALQPIHLFSPRHVPSDGATAASLGVGLSEDTRVGCCCPLSPALGVLSFSASLGGGRWSMLPPITNSEIRAQAPLLNAQGGAKTTTSRERTLAMLFYFCFLYFRAQHFRFRVCATWFIAGKKRGLSKGEGDRANKR